MSLLSMTSSTPASFGEADAQRGAAGLRVKSVPPEARGERTLKGFGVSLDPGSITAPLTQRLKCPVQ